MLFRVVLVGCCLYLLDVTAVVLDASVCFNGFLDKCLIIEAMSSALLGSVALSWRGVSLQASLN